MKYALEMSELGEELRKMGMEPKQESLWWTSTYEREHKKQVPFVTEFDILGYSYTRSEKETKGLERFLNKGLGWWRDGHIFEAKVPSEEVRTCHQPRLECGRDRTRALGLDSGKHKIDEGMGKQDPEDDIQIQEEKGRRMGVP